MSETNYRIKLRKGDLEVEVQGDKQFVLTKFEELTKGEIVIPLEKETKVTLPTSLGEFLRIKGNPRKHIDIAMIYAFWLFKREKMQMYNTKDITNCYDRTRIPKPRNINDVMNSNVKRGFLSVAKEKKDGLLAWVITPTGEEYVEKELK